jgi:group I intron endonuclease
MNYAGSIYVVTNTATNEQYVGLTRKTVQKRWEAHKRTAKCPKSKHYKLHIAIQQYGSAAFVVSELFVAFDEKTLCTAEIQLIADHSPAYNSALGGAGLRPKEFTSEYRKKRSDAAKTRWANLEWRAKTIVALKSSHNTDTARDQCRRLAALRIGVEASKETKARISAAGKLRNAALVDVNSEKTRMIHKDCSAGANVAATCRLYGISKQAFYRHAQRLNLPLFGQKLRGHRSELQ